jgi:hypothetical protein
MFVTVGGVVGAAGYFGYQFFVEEQNNNSVVTEPTPGRSADEIIDHLEEQPRWNGPGNPTFGVGGDQP